MTIIVHFIFSLICNILDIGEIIRMRKLSLLLKVMLVLFSFMACEITSEEDNKTTSGGIVSEDENTTPSVPTFTITFDANGGSGVMEPLVLKEGETVALTKNTFTNPDAEFYGWIVTVNDTETVIADESSFTMVNEDVVLKAKWGTIRHTVSFDPNGGTGIMESIIIGEGVTFNLPINQFEKAGLEFYGWVLTQNNTDIEIADEASFTMGDSDIVLKAKWGAIRHTVTFNANGGIGTMEAIVICEGETGTLTLNSFTNGALHFINWNTDPDGNGITYSNNDPLTMGVSDVVLYAQWDRMFISRWSVTTNKLKFPLSRTGTYDFEIDWGDGTVEHVTTTNGQSYIEHTYAVNGQYTVKVLGLLNGFGYSHYTSYQAQDQLYGNDPDSNLTDILEWGKVRLKPDGYQFYYCNTISAFSATDVLDLSNVASMNKIFSYSSIAGGIENWDVSSVTDMSYAFNILDASTSGNIDISGWDVSNVTNMSYMLSGTPMPGQPQSHLNSDISRWKTTKVTNMRGLFQGNRVFNGDISDWDTANVTNMSYMFLGAKFTGDISGWNTSSVTDMSYMFDNSYFNGDVSGWDVSKVKNFDRMFGYTRYFNCGGINLSTWDWNGKVNFDSSRSQVFYNAEKITTNPPWMNPDPPWLR